MKYFLILFIIIFVNAGNTEENIQELVTDTTFWEYEEVLTNLNTILKLEGDNGKEITNCFELMKETFNGLDKDVKLELMRNITTFCKNSNLNIFLRATGDLDVDLHHTIEDTAIILGEVISKSLSSRDNINRYASKTVIMDESIAKVDIDLCSRLLNIS